MGKKLPLIILSSTIITVSAALIILKKRNSKGEFFIKSYDGKFALIFNNEWKLSKVKNELNENSNLEAINNKNGVCFIMFSKSKEDLNNISLEEYNTNILHGINGENIISSNKIKQIRMKNELYNLGKTQINYEGIKINIYDKERMLIDLARNKNKIGYDLYKEIISNYRKLATSLDTQKIEEYLQYFVNGDKIFEIIQDEVF